jgi:hypothetical protein
MEDDEADAASGQENNLNESLDESACSEDDAD